MSIKVPFGRPSLAQEDIDEVVATLESGWLTSGPKAREFEEKFAQYTGARHAISLNSCTAALQLCLMAAGVGPGDEVITTPLTFVATANAIVHTGAVPVLADVDPKSQNISPERIAERITPRTKAILPVHLLGRAADMAPILELADHHGIAVIGDAAHAIESRYQGESVATLGLAAAFSFQATKSITTGDGGMVTTSDERLARKIRILRSHGLDKDSWGRHGAPRNSGYETVQPGFKYSLPDVAAAMAIRQMDRIERNLAARERQVRRYDAAFAEVAEIILPARDPSDAGGRHAHHLYTILLRLEELSIDRDQFINELLGLGIGCGVHYRAIHGQQYYRERFGYRPGDFPAAEYIADRTVSLPMSPALPDDAIDEVAVTVKNVIEKHRR
jgi:dTDP-4-amino-4,6-dideoxygalactose transaminase